MWVLLLVLPAVSLPDAEDVSLLQLRTDPYCHSHQGALLHGLVKKGHGVDWMDPKQVDLQLSNHDRKKYDEVMGSLAGGMDPQVFLLFFGYARSGHSMIGSLLDAHPEAAVANEFDAIRAYQTGDSRERLLTNLVAVSTAYKLVGRCQAGYHYTVPGVVAKPFGPAKLKVIGDKDGGCNARKQLNVSELVKFQEYVGLDVSLIHVVRNPFDIVATSLAGNTARLNARYHLQHNASQHSHLAENPAEVRGHKHLMASLRAFVDLVIREMTYNMKVRDWIAKGELPGYRWVDVSLTDFVQDPAAQLERLCDFLGLDCEEEKYLSRAASIVRSEEHASRDEIIWPQEMYNRVEEAVAQVDSDICNCIYSGDQTNYSNNF
jgi:hypothetical protein